MQEEFNNASPPNNHAARLDGIYKRLSLVPEGREVVDFLKTNNVLINLKDAKKTSSAAASTLVITGVKNGIYSYKSAEVILNTELSDDNIMQALVHEAQHIRQHLSGVGNPDRILDEADSILFYRIQEADAQAATTDVAWRLKQAGDDTAWKAAKDVGYDDMCDAFEKSVLADPTSLEDGRAKRAAFDSWFEEDSRLAHYNEHTVDFMIPFLAKGRNEIFKDHGMVNAPLDEDWLVKFHGICPKPYLLQPGAPGVLTEPAYRRAMHLRPQHEAKADNDNTAANTPFNADSPYKEESPYKEPKKNNPPQGPKAA